MAGVVILAGHYIDFFNMIMPGTVGDRWFIGVSEIASVLFFWVIYICCVYSIGKIFVTKEILTSKRVNIFIINI
jgi:hypothetical protein